MAVQGPIPVEFATVFPRGVFAAGPFEPVRDFDASKDGKGRDGRELAPSGRPWSLPSLAWQGKEVTSVCATMSLASSTPR